MYQTLLGRAGFRKGMDLYFARHDGTAVTCDDFRAAMADANGVDLAQFERWYTQAGTPQVRSGEREETEYVLFVERAGYAIVERLNHQAVLMVRPGRHSPDFIMVIWDSEYGTNTCLAIF